MAIKSALLSVALNYILRVFNSSAPVSGQADYNTCGPITW